MLEDMSFREAIAARSNLLGENGCGREQIQALSKQKTPFRFLEFVQLQPVSKMRLRKMVASVDLLARKSIAIPSRPEEAFTWLRTPRLSP